LALKKNGGVVGAITQVQAHGDARPPVQLPFADLALHALQSPDRNLSDKKRRPLLGSLRLFEEIVGPVQVGEITERSVLELSELLARTPSRRYLRQRQIESDQPTELNVDISSKVLSARTISQHLVYLAELWEMVQADVQDLDALVNPFRSQDLAKAPPQFQLGLTKRQVESLFDLPVFSEGARPPGCYGEACYWIPLLLLWTGARPTEIAELELSDIQLNDAAKIPTLRLRNSGGPTRRGSQRMQDRDKSQGHRLVPIHNVLLTLNFAGYLSWLKGLEHQHLFPQLNARASRRDPFASFGLWWSGYLQRQGRYPFGRRPASGLRKHWASRARECGLAADTIDHVLGRKTQLAAQPIASVSLVEMERFQVDSYDLSGIQPWRAPDLATVR
jgi:integrase